MSSHLNTPLTSTELLTHYVLIVSTAHIRLRELTKDSRGLREQGSVVPEGIEECIRTLEDAIDRFDGVVDGFVTAMQPGQSRGEWMAMVRREIAILEEMEVGFGET